MAIEDLDMLREKLPDLFEDSRINSDVIQESVVISVDTPLEGLELWIDEIVDGGE